jgi:hypothetical protein
MAKAIFCLLKTATASLPHHAAREQRLKGKGQKKKKPVCPAPVTHQDQECCIRALRIQPPLDREEASVVVLKSPIFNRNRNEMAHPAFYRIYRVGE